MFSLFKKKIADQPGKLPGPSEMPGPVGRTLVLDFGESADDAYALKVVLRPKEEKDRFDIRVFSERMAAGSKVSVKDFDSLNESPNLILYEGDYDKKNKTVQLQTKKKMAA